MSVNHYQDANKPLLSICIATYNRAKYISFTLDSIVSQLTDEVEIVIVDGASTDNTKEIIEPYTLTYKHIRYIRLSKKGGVDYDYCKSIEFANGKMCWLFTDDDLLKPGSVRRVLEEMKSHLSLIIVNAEVMNNDFTKKISRALLPIKDDVICQSGESDKLFDLVITYVSFIGCVIIDRELWLAREKEKYLGTEFIHVGVIFQSILPASTIIIVEPFIQIRYGNAQWSNRAFQIGMAKWPKLLSSFEIISPSIKEKYIFSQFSRWLITMLMFRAKGNYKFMEYRAWDEKCSLSAMRRVISLIIALIPGPLLNFLFLSYLNIFSSNKTITKYDLSSSSNNLVYSCLR